MNDRIKETFDKISAETALKNETKAFIAKKINQKNAFHPFLYQHIVPVMACFVFLLTGFYGYHAYFTQTSIISIDINPSFELNVNQFGKVLSIDSYNDDGTQLANSLKIRYMDYTDALDKILEDESIAAYLSQDELLTISVVGQNEEKSKKILENIEVHIPEQHNVCCHTSNFEEADKAHCAGLSVGKYRAFLELQKVNPNVTIDDVKGLTMRQIQELTGISGETENNPSSGHGSGENRGGHRHRHGAGMN